jgi:predicted outer membrane repeat protein
LENFSFINNSARIGGGIYLNNFPDVIDKNEKFIFMKGFVFEGNMAEE